MPGRSAGSSGGQANEGGSLHRSGVAAVLAALGLKGRGLEVAGYSERGPAPVSLSFETGDAVDDLRCVLADRTSLLLQAKRTCGADRHLRSTVEQWVRQLPTLRPGDFVGLVTATPRGPVRRLGVALIRRRREHPGSFPKAEQDALDAVTERMPAGTSAYTAEAVLDAASVLTIAAATEQEPDFRIAAALLDGAVVRAGSGTAAVRALQRAFQEQATAGRGSGLDDWLRILTDAGLEVFADAAGPAGPRRRAELNALTAYRQRLASKDGWLKLSALAEDLPPLRYDMLADTFQVFAGRRTQMAGGDRLLDVARRWPRMLLIGLPGMGKSTAVEQLAARWAADRRAPVPIVVSLLQVAERRPSDGTDVDLDLLLEIAASSAPAAEQEPLQIALGEATGRGEAVLLLDGLDECRHLRGVVADGLAAVANAIPADAGMLVTTRGSGLAAADKLAFPLARLTEPSLLTGASRMLLRHAAAYRVSEADRNSWIGLRERWLAAIRRNHPDLWTVPLLAMLLTLLAASRSPGQLPASRAQLLAGVVRESVARWELTRPSLQASQPTVLRAEMLTDGFGDIGHAVAGSGACPRDQARAAVIATLTARWGQPPGEAEATADDILSFWDDQVGVFVSIPETGQIEARSRVFSEIGEALWVKRQPTEAQRQWMISAVADEDRRDAVLLAAGLSVEIAEILAEVSLAASDDHAQAVLLVADATHNDAVLRHETLAKLITALAAVAAEPPASRGYDLRLDLPGEPGPTRSLPDPGWPYARRLAMLALPAAALREQRQAMLSQLDLADAAKTVAEALAALADRDIEADGRLQPGQAAALDQLLSVPAGRILLPGYVTVAEHAIIYLPDLGPQAANNIYRIVRSGSAGTYRRVRDRLTSLGYTDPHDRREAGRSSEPDRVSDLWEDWEVLLQATATVSPPEPTSLIQRWRLPDLATLIDLLDPFEATVVSVEVAYSAERDRLPDWTRATAKAAGLDLAAVAAQADAVLTGREEGDNSAIEVITAPLPSAPPRCDIARLDHADITILVDALGAESEWLADVACALLLTGRDASIATRVAQLPTRNPAARKRNTAITIANDPSPPEAALRALDSDDPAVRRAAPIVARIMTAPGHDSAPWMPVITRLRNDDDVTVRLAFDEDTSQEGATIWSCSRCGQLNGLAAFTCEDCGRSRRQRDVRIARLALLQGGYIGSDLPTDTGATR